MPEDRKDRIRRALQRIRPTMAKRSKATPRLQRRDRELLEAWGIEPDEALVTVVTARAGRRRGSGPAKFTIIRDLDGPSNVTIIASPDDYPG